MKKFLVSIGVVILGVSALYGQSTVVDGKILPGTSHTIAIDGTALSQTANHEIIFTASSASVAPPVFSPVAGSYTVTKSVQVTLTSPDKNAVMYYHTGSPVGTYIKYTGPFWTAAHSENVYAYSVVNGVKSPTSSVYYTITVSPGGTPPPPTPPPPSSPPATGTALTKCGAITAPGTYYLANDVACTSSSFGINAEHVVLNLNGHTITYGSPSRVVPAITECDGWYSKDSTTGISLLGCTGSGQHSGAEIYGGTFVEAANAASFTPTIWAGQGSDIGSVNVHDTHAKIHGIGAQFIHGDYAGGGWKVVNNVIDSTVTNIQLPGQSPLGARSHFQGVVINIAGGGGAADTITGNTLNGSAQGGIISPNVGSIISGNAIHLTSKYSNDYGITSMVNGQQITSNIIDGDGRGLDLEGSDFKASGNTINVQEIANNSEYGGCELGGSDGIRVKQYVTGPTNPGTITNYGAPIPPYTGWSIDSNKVNVSGAVCAAHGLRFTNMTSGVSGTVANNVFTVGGVQLSVGLSVAGSQYPSITFVKNTFDVSGKGGFLAQIAGDGDMWPAGGLTVNTGQVWSAGVPTVYSNDFTKGMNSEKNIFTILDNVQNPSVVCTSYSTTTVKVGSAFSQTCGQ